MTQLFGDRALIANATGCSSIYGGNLPTTPYTVNLEGRGPAWSNSLFEDNAEFGMGMRLAVDKQNDYAKVLVRQLASEIGDELAVAILDADQSSEPGIFAQRERVAELKKKLANVKSPQAKDLLVVSDALVKKSVWIIGGDGWGYDWLWRTDHVLASTANVNILLLDREFTQHGRADVEADSLGAVAVRRRRSAALRRHRDDGMNYSALMSHVAMVAVTARR